ncbi:MAG: hypothetical protein CMG77_02580 [Marinimicrobium sp.]|nr:hypothetical protein [Marinimicrobium sp.]
MMKRVLATLLFLPLGAVAGDLQPFETDGCSSFPDGTVQNNELWLSCCIAHDYAYWIGGTYRDRLDADNELKRCVADVGEPEIAMLMLAGVRVGGTPFLPTEFRWGYGWPFLRGYKALTENELDQIRALEGEGDSL